MENSSELIRKDEYVRIIIQSLYSLGYNNSASYLESQSGVSYKSRAFQSLESTVLNGDWDGCTTVLNSIKDVLGETMDSALFLVLRQRFVGHVSRGEVASALDVLRKQISVLHVDKSKTLTEHREKVWFVQFSNNGEFLASSSNDCTIIWKVGEHGNLSPVAKLRNFAAVSFVAWSPDDTKLLTYGDQILKLWDIRTGTCKLTFGNQGYVISSCAWCPNSTQFVWGNSGPGEGIYIYDSDDKMTQVHRVRWMPNVASVAFTPDGAHFICIFTDQKILIHHIRSRADRAISEAHPITSISVSRDSLLFIVSLSNHEIHMWDVAGKWTMPLSFVGHKQHEHVIRSCIGGWNSRFIASGSEDSQVYIWNRRYPRNPILVLSGHSNIVNCVSWNPRRPQMLASASDDCTIRIWGPNS